MINTFSFVLGMFLLVSNPFVGYGGIVLFAFLYKKTKKKIFIFFSGFSYLFSWLMFFAGAFLAGPQGLKITKTFVEENIVLTLLAVAVIVAVVIIQGRRMKNNAKAQDK